MWLIFIFSQKEASEYEQKLIQVRTFLKIQYSILLLKYILVYADQTIFAYE
jgi:hypothetical protein